jgi:hypothetical protein
MSSLRVSTTRSAASGKRSSLRSTSSVRSSRRRRRKGEEEEEEEESYTLATINLKRRELEVVKDMIQTQIIGIGIPSISLLLFFSFFVALIAMLL